MWAKLANIITRYRESPDLRNDIGRATRCVIAFAAPMMFAFVPGTGIYYIYAGLAAQNIAAIDVRGDYRLRLAILLAAAFLFAGAGALGAAIGPGLVMSVVSTVIVSLCMVALRHLNGDYGPGVGVTMMVIFVITLATPHNSPAHVEQIALWTLGGGLWGVIVQVALWPLRPQHPLRRIVSDSWAAAADLFNALKIDEQALAAAVGNARALRDPRALILAQQQLLAEKESALRGALEKARVTLHGARTKRSEEFLHRLEKLSSLSGELAPRVVALHTALTTAIHQNPALAELEPAFQPILVSLTNTSRTIALAVVSRDPGHLALGEVRMRRLGNLLISYAGKVASLADSHTGADLGLLIGMVNADLTEVLFALRGTIDRSAERAAFSLELLDIETWSMKPFASAINLSGKVDPQLIAFGARITAILVIGTIIANLTHLPHGYWLVFTIVLLLQPDYGSTRQRVAHRLVGTLFGSFVGSALLWVPMPYAMEFVLMTAAMFVFMSVIRRNYGIAVFFITIHVVLLTELNQVVTWQFTLERVACTTIGGLLALGAALLFWPVWERSRVPKNLAAALAANLEYWKNLFVLINETRPTDDATNAAYRKADAANSDIFASLKRMMADPATQREGLEETAAIANGNQRLTRLLNVIALRLADNRPLVQPNLALYGETGARALRTLSEVIVQPDTDAGIAKVLACQRELETSRLHSETRTRPPMETGDFVRTQQVMGQLSRAGTEINAMLLATERCLREGVFEIDAK